MIKQLHFYLGCALGLAIIFVVIFLQPGLVRRVSQSGAHLLGLTTGQPPVEIIFGGDLMMDRYIRQRANQLGYDYILADLKQTLTQADLVVVNLEGPVTDYASQSIGSQIGSSDNYIFTMAPEVAKVLFDHNMKLVNIGNNHMLNFGVNGLDQTKQHLTEQGVKYFGATGQGDDQTGVVWEINHLKLGFVNYNQFITGGLAVALAEIDKLKPSTDLLIVYTHWGNEYQSAAGSASVATAHQLIDGGADLVIGSHPHVVQPSEEYRGKMIYYSLGNLVFDQYFSAQTKQGLLVKVLIEPDTQKLSFTEIPIKMDLSGQTTLIK